ncbi:hypothetical protein K523DRAFT_197780, partial [Schizophyllum commune Tattone D]
MELGAPMVAMYLLGHPDHYSSHRFRPFYWTTFYHHIHQFWTHGETDEKVLLMRKKGRIIGISEAQNYIFRAHALGHLKLYDFMLLCEREQIPKPGNKEKAEAAEEDSPRTEERLDVQIDAYEQDGWIVEDEDDGERSVLSDEEQVEGDEDEDEAGLSAQNQSGVVADNTDVEMGPSEVEGAAMDDVVMEDVDMEEPLDDMPTATVHPPTRELPRSYHAFLYGHSQANSHCMKIRAEIDPTLVLNFMRWLPRNDGESRDEYIRVMLMLFKPWRHARDLKEEDETWEEAFANHNFTERERELMRNFNLRWECIDGRDNFREVLRNGGF